MRLLQNTSRTPGPASQAGQRQGYMMIEALVYIGLVVVILGTATAVMFRCVDNSVVLRRNAEDVAAAMNAGERWRADVRAAREELRLEGDETSQMATLPTERGDIAYLFSTNIVFRRVGEGPWVRALSNIKSSAFERDPRRNVTAWRWEVELLPRTKGYNKPGRVRPLFTFVAVPERSAAK